MVEKAKGYLGDNDVPVEEEDNMFAVVSGGFMAYLRQTTEFATRTMSTSSRWLVRPARCCAGPASTGSSARVTGVGTSTELCYMWHRSALGYAVNVGEDSIDIGYDEKQDTSWSRATVFHGAKILQNTGIVQMKHDGSAFGLTAFLFSNKVVHERSKAPHVGS
jgi:hypothetical protein